MKHRIDLARLLAFNLYQSFWPPLDLCRVLAVVQLEASVDIGERIRATGMLRAIHSLAECPEEAWALELRADGEIAPMVHDLAPTDGRADLA